MSAWVAVVFFLAGCTGGDNTASALQVCQDLCMELAVECGYAAYPNYDSCVQGCVYNREVGADVDGELTCVLSAACDTFAVVECEHAYGLE
ncbi:MAG: hypothetical protein JXX28_14885 [Deltaproteobacteria bacterium]|nr:hypothetical protein [Deltaproteobacteria bacterium]